MGLHWITGWPIWIRYHILIGACCRHCKAFRTLIQGFCSEKTILGSFVPAVKVLQNRVDFASDLGSLLQALTSFPVAP